jgi:aspartyl-tRNA(Asn)/glutamyl-tRNA(Gln) amidotransferase subunit A
MAKNYTSYIEIKSGLMSGEITAEGLVKGYLQQIKANAHLNVFNEVFEDEALASAKQVDARISNGTAGKLAGMVIAIKITFATKGIRFPHHPKF